MYIFVNTRYELATFLEYSYTYRIFKYMCDIQ